MNVLTEDQGRVRAASAQPKVRTGRDPIRHPIEVYQEVGDAIVEALVPVLHRLTELR